MNRKKTTLAAIAALMTFSGCGKTTSASIPTAENVQAEIEADSNFTEAEQANSTEDTFTWEEPDENTNDESCESPYEIGFVTGTHGPSGTVKIEDPLTFRVYLGRVNDTRTNEVSDNGGKSYDKYQGCEFILKESLYFTYVDKRGKNYISCDEAEINQVKSFPLPDLMEKKYVVERKYKKTNTGAKLILVLTEYVEVTINLSEYTSYFYEAHGHVCDFNDPLYNQEVKVELDVTYLHLFFDVYAIKDGKECGVWGQRLSVPKFMLQNNILSLKYI